MQDLTIFKNENLGEIRVIFIDNEPLFCLADICKALNLTNPTMVANAIKSEFGDDLSLTYPIIDNLGRKQNATFVTEPQLYFVLMRSDKAEAKEFRKWINTEVLPSIRKTGSYSIQQQLPKTYGEALLEAGRLAIENERLLTQAKDNTPYQIYVDRGYFKVIESTYRYNESKEVKINHKTIIYPKGQDFIIKLLKNPTLENPIKAKGE